MRERFERIGDSRLAASLTAATRLCVPETYHAPEKRSQLLTELTRMFSCLRRKVPVAVVIDDVHAVPAPVLAVAPARQAGCTVIVACADAADAAATIQLAPLADCLINLGPLSDDHADALVVRTAGAGAGVRVDDGLAPALRNALGSLAGNPSAIVATVDELICQDRLAVVRDWLCLADPAAPIALPADHHLPVRVRELGLLAQKLIALVATAERFGVDDLPAFAAATGRDLAACGAVVDRLVTIGALLDGDNGSLCCPCPALATTVRGQLGPLAVRRIHARLADHLLSLGDRACPNVLMERVALAADALPGTPRLADLLIEAGDRMASAKPDLAARRYVTALWHARGEHPEHARVLSEVLRILVRTGEYEWLGRLVEEVTDKAERDGAGVDAAERPMLAAAAALASLHTAIPVPARTRAALEPANRTDGPDPLEFCARWFAGQQSIALDEMAAMFGAFRVAPARWPTPVTRRRRDAVTAATRHDLVTVFEYLLGAGYAKPVTGLLAAYHRVVAAYTSGDWSAALSAVRELELTRSAGSVVRDAARLLAVEMCGSRGEAKRAAAWLEDVARDGPFPALRAWAEAGLLIGQGEWQAAYECGWRAVTSARPGYTFGLEWLLPRLAYVCATIDGSARILAVTSQWRRAERTWDARSAELMVRAMVEKDFVGAREAADVLRTGDNKIELMWACVIAGVLADQPSPWLLQAYAIAKSAGAEVTRAFVKDLMRGRGMAPPRSKAPKEPFSPFEKRIIELIESGLTNRQIAHEVRLSEKTLESYITRLFAKTGCRSRFDLAAASLEGRLTVVSA